MPDGTADVKLAFEPVVAEWRNWQTHQTQNLAKFTLRVGSTPTSATNVFPPHSIATDDTASSEIRKPLETGMAFARLTSGKGLREC
jgi:hypothetical protein